MSKIKRSTLDYSIIDGLDIEALRRIIEEDFDSPDGILDKEIWLYACEALARKEKEQGAETPDIEESLEEFKREYLPYANNNDSPVDCGEETADNVVELPKKKHLRKPFIKILAAIIAILVLGTVTASAMGVDVWKGIVSWTRETFGFNEQSSMESKGQIPEQLLNMADLLREQEITPENILPTYIPDGYTENDSSIMDLDDYIMIMCSLKNENSEIILQCIVNQSNLSNGNNYVYQKNDMPIEEYLVSGIAHYVVYNESGYTCMWTNENVECSIMSVDSRKELLLIINSIYEE